MAADEYHLPPEGKSVATRIVHSLGVAIVTNRVEDGGKHLP